MTVSRKSTIKQKIGDLIMIGAIIATVAVSIPFVSMRTEKAGAAYTVVEVNGKETLRIALGENQRERTFTLDGFAGESVVEVKDSRIRMLESACRDKLCIGMGWADNIGDSIVCVPNRVVIKLIGPARHDKVDSITE